MKIYIALEVYDPSNVMIYGLYSSREKAKEDNKYRPHLIIEEEELEIQ